MTGLLGIGEACAYLGIGRSKLYELIAAGEIATVKIGRSVKFTRSDLDEFVERNRTTAKGLVPLTR